MCCPNIFGVRIPNNGAILTAAIGHQVIHVALPRHIQEIDPIYLYIYKKKSLQRWENGGTTTVKSGGRRILQSNPHFDVYQRQGWGSKESHGSEAAAGCSPYQITPHNELPGAFMGAGGGIKGDFSRSAGSRLSEGMPVQTNGHLLLE